MRNSKIITAIVSLFTSNYVYLWSKYFPDTSLLYPPSFDGRGVLYVKEQTLRDYLSWRQVDCHINNLYNTCFWALVNEGGMSTKEAEEKLRYTVSSDKNELLFSQFHINYNRIDEQYRKGSIIVWEKEYRSDTSNRCYNHLKILHENLIDSTFWEKYSYLIE
jgi:tRNA(His) guanylyltransferase